VSRFLPVDTGLMIAREHAAVPLSDDMALSAAAGAPAARGVLCLAGWLIAEAPASLVAAATSSNVNSM
jgi:hypothetical protein